MNTPSPTTPRAAGPASGDALREALAEAFYQVDPFYVSPEYVEQHPVSPGGYLTWNEALSYDAEFDGVLPSITKPAFDRAGAFIIGPLAPILAERDTATAAAEAAQAEIGRLRAALQHVADMEPATTDMTLAHEMAQEAHAALTQEPHPHDPR